MARKKRGFGQLRRLPSKRWQAGYTGPDTAMHYAPSTFDTDADAEAWLSAERRLIQTDAWTPPKVRKQQRHAPKLTFGAYAESWLAGRELKPRTFALYRRLLDKFVLLKLGAAPVRELDSADVREWYATLSPDRPTQRAHAYGLVRSILSTAVADEIIPSNPARIRGAGVTRRARKVRPASLDELATIVERMPARLGALVLVAAWCALRFGELAELRRKDVDVSAGVIHVRRAITRVNGKVIIGTPKSDAGIRDVALPPHLWPAVKDHLAEHVLPGDEALVFPSTGDPRIQLHSNTLNKHWYPARAAAGRPDLRFHDLRHTGAVLAASTGATLAELMGRLGHSTPAAAMRYQHAAHGRDAEIASALSRLVDTGDTP